MPAPRPIRYGLILASGVGRRIGGPKALLLWQGEPLAQAHARVRSGDCDQVFVVTRAAIAQVLAKRAPEYSLVISSEPDELGPAGSIAAAVRGGALAGAEQVLVTPVDVPPASVELVEALGRGLGTAEAIRPKLRGELGHPVLCRAGLLVEAYARQAPMLREVLAALGAGCRELEVREQDILADFDTIERFVARTGCAPDFLR